MFLQKITMRRSSTIRKRKRFFLEWFIWYGLYPTIPPVNRICVGRTAFRACRPSIFCANGCTRVVA